MGNKAVNFDAIIKKKIDGETVRMCLVTRTDTTDGPLTFWNGSHNFTSGNVEWNGVGGAITTGSASKSFSTTAPSVSLSTVPLESQYARRVRDDFKTKIRGQRMLRYLQFFDDALDNNWQPLGEPIPFDMNFIDNLGVSRSGTDQYGINITCEGPFVRRNTSSPRMLTDFGLKRQFPEARGLERVSSIPNREVKWLVRS